MASDLILRLGEACRDAPSAVLAIYLFGSVARGDERRAGDVDIGAFVADPAPSVAEVEAFIDRLESLAKRRIDFVVVNRASADFVHRILRDGIVLLDRDRPARLRFEVQRRNEYFDLEPIRREYRAPRRERTAHS